MKQILARLAGSEMTVDLPVPGKVSSALSRQYGTQGLEPVGPTTLLPQPADLSMSERASAERRLGRYKHENHPGGLSNAMLDDLSGLARHAQRPLAEAGERLILQLQQLGAPSEAPGRANAEGPEVLALRARLAEVHGGLGAADVICNGKETPRQPSVEHVATLAASLDRAMQPGRPHSQLSPALQKLRDIANIPASLDLTREPMDFAARPEWSQRAAFGGFPDLPSVEDMSDAQRAASEKKLRYVANGDGFSPDLARNMQRSLLTSRVDIRATLMHSRDAILSDAKARGIALSAPKDAAAQDSIGSELRGDYASVGKALEMTEALKMTPRSPEEAAHAAMVIGAGLEAGRDPEARSPSVDAWITSCRDISFIPAMISARERERYGAEMEAADVARMGYAKELQDAQAYVERTPDRNAADMAIILQSVDHDVFSREKSNAVQGRRVKLAASKKQLQTYPDPLAPEALAIRKRMLEQTLILDPHRRNAMMTNLTMAEVSAQKEKAGVIHCALQMRSEAVGDDGVPSDRALARHLTARARAQATRLDAPGKEGFTRDQRIHMRSLFRLADRQEGVLAPAQISTISDILMTKAAFDPSGARTEVHAMKRLASAMPEMEIARRQDLERS